MLDGVFVIVGFPGAGKTAVARELKDKFGFKVVDIDSEIEKAQGKSVSEIIRVEGERRFRELEKEAIESAVDSDVAFITLGGGALTVEEIRSFLLSAQKEEKIRILHLEVSCERASERIYEDELRAFDETGVVQRPLVASSVGLTKENVFAKVSELFGKRRGVYDVSKLKVVTDFASAACVAEELCRMTDVFDVKKDSFTLIPAEIGSFKHTVIIGSGLFSYLEKMTSAYFEKRTDSCCVVDENVLLKCESLFGGFLGKKVKIPSGEASKSLSQVEKCCDELLREGFDRGLVIQAVGGGVVGDLAGLVSSLYMRGVGIIQVGTTVVSQADSAIGGKTGVNLQGGKNMLGTFNPARVVMCDLDFLTTLPEREYVAGLAEVVKYGLICSEEFFEWLENNISRIQKRNLDALKHVVEFSVKSKLSFVVGDLEDKAGRRAILNFGHTVGHALEKLTGYKTLLHGEAVSLGMIAALRLGERRGVTSKGLLGRTQRLLSSLGLPTKFSSALSEYGSFFGKGTDEVRSRWVSALSADKKRDSTSINYIFVEKLGRPSIEKITPEEIFDGVF